MKNYINYRDKLTVLVNSCDAYSDLWFPFFKLLKKYLPIDTKIILNTESKDFSFQGLDIACIHPPYKKKYSPYGARMLYALSQVQTEYVLLLLDDFFLRKPVNLQDIDNILDWLDKDIDIVCFNSEANTTYENDEVNVYPGYKRVPMGNAFTLNMQAAVWRTKALKKYWRPYVTPWEWEIYCNLLTARYPKDKFYCSINSQNSFADYGHYQCGDIWGVVKGKWVITDVQPLFEKEDISVDFSIRGSYCKETAQPYYDSNNSKFTRYSRIYRCLGFLNVIDYFLFSQCDRVAFWIGHPIKKSYFEHLINKARLRYLRSKRNK